MGSSIAWPVVECRQGHDLLLRLCVGTGCPNKQGHLSLLSVPEAAALDADQIGVSGYCLTAASAITIALKFPF